jgi:protein PhnA
MSDELKKCPHCECPYGYSNGEMEYICPECSHIWLANKDNAAPIVLDCNGNPLQDCDSVIVIKDLPVKSAPKPLKAGTKVKNIRLVFGDHNIDCKIDGFGSMALKSEFVKKA